MNIINFFSDISLDEKSHIYKVKDKYVKTSVSKVIKRFYEPFDSYTISKRKAEKDGVKQEYLLKKWEDERVKSINKGHSLHKFAENFVKKCDIVPKSKDEEAVVKFFYELPNNVKPYVTELSMYCPKYEFCGTADLILYNEIKDKFYLCDYKTNKDLFKNFNNKKLLYPFEDLLDTPFNKYQIQLSLYQMMFETSGYNIDKRKIIWINKGNYKIYDTKNFINRLKKVL